MTVTTREVTTLWCELATGRAENVDRLVEEVGRRWRERDRLLPAPGRPRPEDEHVIYVRDTGGTVRATGTMQRSVLEPGDSGLTWGVRDQHWLTPLVGGADPAATLDTLLSMWREQLYMVPERGDPETAAAVTWPSRDVTGISALRRHGLQPYGVVAARLPGRGEVPAAPPPGVRVRAAGVDDLPVLVELLMEEHHYEQHFGGVLVRPQTERQTHRVLEQSLSYQPAWVWLAERDDRAVGLIWASPPERARWAAPLAAARPAGYIGYGMVTADERGRGTGAALVAHAHRRLDAEGVGVTLLNYSQANPLSGPFWSRMGYRPLWTTWEVRPVGALR
ncbi:GNAT family N-acetyltransferase [Allonocardiopsis opalescens]|uniref:Acetyltransferase (GNAT) family protein n=1 Tax=Allonocardiopsis opalescens TaxID=1144618 RepID=A0A2T0Q4E1_9ACTN|nr:GNAT family N-acetyltransferase [Allonocardiopsis opalescens]PRX98639.1 acetyltransferase (GNAT) family protein [Allonocardiopsis opalescens]